MSIKPKRKYVRKKKMTKDTNLEVIAQQAFKLEEPPKYEHKMPFGVLELLRSQFEVEGGGSYSPPPYEPTDADITEAELRDQALDRITAVMVKLGVSEADLELAFGIEPSSVRKAKKPKKNNGKALGKT